MITPILISDTHFSESPCAQAASTINIMQPPKNEKLQQFYQLYYPATQNSSPHRSNHKFSSRSLLSKPPSVLAQELIAYSRPKGSLTKLAESPKAKQRFSYRRMLAINTPEGEQCLPQKILVEMEEFGRGNVRVKRALQRGREEKSKMYRLLQSYKQSEEVKMEYLNLKRKELREEVELEGRNLYDSLFREEYEAKYGQAGYEYFQERLNGVLTALRRGVFQR